MALTDKMDGTSRREFLTALGAVAGAATVSFAPGELLAQAASPAPKPVHIDVHHHFYPPEFRQAVNDFGGGRVPAVEAWTPQKSLEQLDMNNVSTAIVSLWSIPGVWMGADVAGMRKWARFVNDYGAKMMADYPGRFGLFAALPLPDVEGSLKEIEYGLDVLNADGVSLFTSYGDKWIGDPVFDRVFEELNRRKAVVYTHPTTCNCCTNLLPGLPDSTIEYQTDTSRAIARLVFSGTAARCPDIKLIWSHGGGTMPFLIDRFINATRMPQYREQFPGGFLPVARRFYYDTAQVPNRPALSALTGVVPVDNILFGTDFPWLTAEHHVTGLRECRLFSDDELRAIDGENAARLMPQFKR